MQPEESANLRKEVTLDVTVSSTDIVDDVERQIQEILKKSGLPTVDTYVPHGTHLAFAAMRAPYEYSRRRSNVEDIVNGVKALIALIPGIENFEITMNQDQIDLEMRTLDRGDKVAVLVDGVKRPAVVVSINLRTDTIICTVTTPKGHLTFGTYDRQTGLSTNEPPVGKIVLD